MKKYNVAVLGATGAVGQEMMKILEERSFPIAGLRAAGQRQKRREDRDIPRPGGQGPGSVRQRV